MSEKYVTGSDRGQELVLPERLDEYVDEDNEVRFIDAFVDTLDLSELSFTHSKPNDEGRPSYNPRDLLKLYVWGYLNQVRSSRKLERECHRNLELLWLMRKLAPDFWTISEFRKQNVDRIKGVFREFVSFLQDVDLVEAKLASIDGSKMKAVNARKRNFTKAYLESKLKRIEERVERYMKELEQNDDEVDHARDDGEERGLIKKRNDYLRAKLERLKKSKKELEQVREALKKSGKNEISLTDPDSRSMMNNGKMEVCYNAELTVDKKAHIIVDYDVTNEANDEKQLAPMAKSAKEILGVDELEVVADSGFSNMAQIKDCVENGITPYLPATRLDGTGVGRQAPDPAFFGKNKFVYDGKRDVYVCPAGEELTFRYVSTRTGGNASRVYFTNACKTCPFKARCTKSGQRRMFRWVEYQEVIDELVERTRRVPEKLEERVKLAEHPFGTMKRAFNQGYFLLKGLTKVNGEMGFTALAYDMRRALNVLGTRSLVQALMMLAAVGGQIIR
jgi:transposase